MRQVMPGEEVQDASADLPWFQLLRALRRTAGITQEGWAARLGYGRRTVQRWERGQSPPDAAATAAILDLCSSLVLYRTYRQGALAGLTVTPDLVRDLLAEARQGRDREVASDQLGATGVSSPVPGTASHPPRHNLPVQLTSFVGRDLDRVNLGRRLRQDRLLTIVGVGGVGKTRLALQVAAEQLGSFADGVWLVELHAVTEPSLVAGAVARTLRVREQSGADVTETLIEALRSQDLVLVVDNCEHLVAECALLLERLLRACSHLHVLATSREPLGVPGEVLWRLPSLAVPPALQEEPFEMLVRVEAMQLFADRAGAVQQDFRLHTGNIAAVAQICRALDGIPLAIELAAARVAILSPQQIAARLDDRFRLLVGGSRTAPTRQQTLRATLDWSYDLLTAQERSLFDRLSVFADSFDLDGVEAVGEDIPDAADGRTDLLDTLAGLVARSLVSVEQSERGEERDTRYRILETVRAYGQEHLAGSGELDRVQQRHATWLLDLAEEAESRLHGRDQGRWLRRIQRELGSLRSALAWAIQREHAELALRLAGAQAWYWFAGIRGDLTEGRFWLERALLLRDAPSFPRARALAGAVLLAMLQGDLASAHRWVEEQFALSRELRDEEVLLTAQGAMAQLLLITGDFAAAERLDDETLELARRLGDPWATCRKLANKAYCALHRGDPAGARACLEESAELARQVEDTWSLAMALGELGDLDRSQGRHDRAGALYAESVALHRSLGVSLQTPSLVHNLGYVALAGDDTERAAGHFRDALAQFRWRGDRRGIAECVIGLAAVAAAEGDYEGAAQLFGAGEAALESLNAQLWPSNRPDYERWVARARAALPSAVFDRRWSEGRRLPLDEAALKGEAAGSGH